MTQIIDKVWLVGSNLDLILWSCIEIATAVICACLPALKPLLSRYLPQMFGNTTRNTTGHAYNTQLSQRSLQQSRRNIRIPDQEAGTLSKAQAKSDSESTLVDGARGRRWLDDENTELVAMRMTGK